MQLIVNDYWRLALAASCDFVHLGRGRPRRALTCGRCAAPSVRVGVSTHDAAELERALGIAPDYVALGPIYHTTLKVMPGRRRACNASQCGSAASARCRWSPSAA